MPGKWMALKGISKSQDNLQYFKNMMTSKTWEQKKFPEEERHCESSQIYMNQVTQSTRNAEYTNCIPAEGVRHPQWVS